jgi:predicted ATPase
MLLQLNRFFGRAEEIAQLQWLLEPGAEGAARLVTLTGPSGAGKTRLAVEVAAILRAAYGDREWFVSLADLSDGSLVGEAIAGAMRLQREPNQDPLECVVASLNGGPSLLLLDNFEHLTESGTVLVETLIERAPSLSLLVTSQHRLEVAGERELPVMPLPTPAEESTAEQALECPSVRLFVDRAQAARPDFVLTERNATAVATLCSRLEGVPLAIELAAAWAQMLTPAQMVARLSNRFDLLVSPRKRGLARHRTLRSAITWSYRLLSPELQRLFARLSVFRGGWDLDAARDVCED